MKNFLIYTILVLSGVAVFMPQGVRAFDPGCTPSGPYSTTTGKLCAPGDFGTVCPEGDLYSTLTGKICNVWVSKSSVQNSNNYSPNTPLSISTSGKLPTGFMGKAYSIEVVANGGPEGYVWKLAQGSLPPGLSLNKNSTIVCIKAPCVNRSPAVISGSPTRSGVYPFTLSISSGSKSLTKPFSIEVRTR